MDKQIKNVISKDIDVSWKYKDISHEDQGTAF
jgi:hypothetical protein